MLPLRAYVDKFCNSEGITKGGEDLCAKLIAQQHDELVLSVYNLLVVKKQFSHINIRPSKNEVDAEEYMALGVDAFASNDDVLCINYQTICIALSPPNSPLLPIAYAYRSASLFRLDRFSACLMDVNRALQEESGLTGPYENMKLSLLERKKICIAELKREKLDRFNKEAMMSQLAKEAAGEEKDDEAKKESAEKREDDKSLAEQPTMSRSKKKKLKKLQKLSAKKEMLAAIDEIDEETTNANYEDKFPLPLIADSNEMIPNASAKVNISFSLDYGRHLVATDDIKPGEILFVERSFAAALFPQFYYTCCRYCYVRCEALIPCPKCLLGTYCSESCRSKAFDEFHRVECPIMYTLMKLQVIGDTHLALRLLLIATKQGANLSSMMQHPTFKSPMEIFYGPIEGQFLSEDYNNVHNLMDNYRKSTSFSIFEKCYEVAVLLYLLKHTTFFGRSEEDDSVVDTDNLSDEEIFAGTMLLKFMFLSACNGCPLKDMLETPTERPGDEEYYHTSLIGYGLYPLYSLMNHSCDPNALPVNHKDSIVCYAVQPIKRGEQIFSNYHWCYSRVDKMSRQSRLYDGYFFHCRCNACERDWMKMVLYLNCPPRRISNKITEKELRDYERKFKMYTSKAGLNTTSQEDLDFLIELISVYHKCVRLPCQTYIEASECFSFLLAKRGNAYEIEDDFIVCKLAFLSGNRTVS